MDALETEGSAETSEVFILTRDLPITRPHSEVSQLAPPLAYHVRFENTDTLQALLPLLGTRGTAGLVVYSRLVSWKLK